MNVKGMVRMGVAATTIGPFDLFRGADYLRTLIEDSSLPVVSANVYDESTGELFVSPYTIVERAGVKFGITGLLDPDADIRTHKDVEQLGVTIGEPTERLREVLAELEGKVDFVILLSQLGLDNSKLIAEEVPGIDFMVVGVAAQYAAKPYEIGETVMIQPGYKGQRISDYTLHFDAERAFTGYTGETIDLGDKIPSDAEMALLLKEHKLAIEEASKRRAAEKRGEAVPTAKQYKAECLGGAATCARCHAAQREQWLGTGHARAFKALEQGNQLTNPACLRCHSTCYLDMPLDGSVVVQENLRNVQCEACHGKATDHARDGSYGKVTAATCVRCHDKENSPNFDFESYLARVTH